MPSSSPLRCPACGVEMNHHADKLRDPATEAEARGIDPLFGAVLEEIHGCPRCSRAESRLLLGRDLTLKIEDD